MVDEFRTAEDGWSLKSPIKSPENAGLQSRSADSTHTVGGGGRESQKARTRVDKRIDGCEMVWVDERRKE